MALLLGAASPAVSAAAVDGATPAAEPALSKYVAVTPVRILDTRTGVGAPEGRPAADASVELQITGHGEVPTTDVTAVALNVVVTDPRTLGYVQALPSGTGELGDWSNIDIYYPGQTASNLITVPVGANGAVTLYDVPGGDLVADVLGYFTTASTSTDGRYQALTPSRLVDSRTGFGLPPVSGTPPKLSAGQSLSVQLTGHAGVPSTGVSSVALTVTAAESTKAGFVQVVPTDGAAVIGSTSNVNLTGPGQTVANLTIVPVGTGGNVQLYSSSGTHVIVDVVGYFTDTTAAAASTGLFVPLSPARLLDTRLTPAPAAAGSTSTLALLGVEGIPSTGVSAVFLNPTAADTDGAGYLQLYPTGHAVAGAFSSVNYWSSTQTVANAAIATVGDGGGISIYTPTTTDVVVDAFGYFTG